MRSISIALSAFTAAAGCSLFVDTSGLEGGDGGASDATTNDESSQNHDASDDRGDAQITSDDAGDAADSDVSLDGCVLLLHMNEATWPAVGAVHDSSGNANDGTPMNGAQTTSDGKFGRAGLFNGTDWVIVPASASLDGVITQLTYSAWIYPTALTDGGNSPGIISKRQAYGMNVAYTLFLNYGNNAYFDLQDARANSNFVFGNNAWYHVAVVYDGSQSGIGVGASIYINGVLDSVHPAAPSIAANTQDILIANLPNGGDIFTGMIDEVAIWTRALSADEIHALYVSSHQL